LTRLDQWQTYKINQIDALDLPANGGQLVVPLKWFGVAQWWKDMVKPTLEHAAVNVDNVVRAELMISGGAKEGEHVFALHAMRLHGLQKRPGACDIVYVVIEGPCHRIGYCLQPREMYDCVDPMITERAIEQAGVANVSLDEAGPLAGDLLDAVNDDRRAVAEIVEHDGVVAGVDQFDTGMRAHIAGAAGEKDYCHALAIAFDASEDSRSMRAGTQCDRLK